MRIWPMERAMSSDARPRRRGPGRRPDARGRRDAGQSLAEFVLVIPIFLLLVFGVVEFGLAFRTHQIITNTAREGARVSVLPDARENEVLEVVIGRLESAGLDPDEAGITFSCAEGDGSNESEGLCEGTDRWGMLSVVEVTYPYRFFILGGLVRWACGSGCDEGFGTVTLRTVSTMRNE
jgi:Flp pilus assembly protein TadG